MILYYYYFSSFSSFFLSSNFWLFISLKFFIKNCNNFLPFMIRFCFPFKIYMYYKIVMSIYVSFWNFLWDFFREITLIIFYYAMSFFHVFGDIKKAFEKKGTLLYTAVNMSVLGLSLIEYLLLLWIPFYLPSLRDTRTTRALYIYFQVVAKEIRKINKYC